MNKHNLRQLGIFNPQHTYLFADEPCVLCGSDEQVLAVLFKLPKQRFPKLAYLCSECQSNPAIFTR